MGTQRLLLYIYVNQRLLDQQIQDKSHENRKVVRDNANTSTLERRKKSKSAVTLSADIFDDFVMSDGDTSGDDTFDNENSDNENANAINRADQHSVNSSSSSSSNKNSNKDNNNSSS